VLDPFDRNLLPINPRISRQCKIINTLKMKQKN